MLQPAIAVISPTVTPTIAAPQIFDGAFVGSTFVSGVAAPDLPSPKLELRCVSGSPGCGGTGSLLLATGSTDAYGFFSIAVVHPLVSGERIFVVDVINSINSSQVVVVQYPVITGGAVVGSARVTGHGPPNIPSPQLQIRCIPFSPGCNADAPVLGTGGTDTLGNFSIAVASLTQPGELLFARDVPDELDGPTVTVAAAPGIVRVIDQAKNQLLPQTIMVGNDPAGVAFTPDGTRAYVTNRGDGTVSVIDTASYNVISTIPLPIVSNDGLRTPVPIGIAITRQPAGVLGGGIFAYVVDQEGDKVSVIDTASNAVIGGIGVGFFPFGIAIGTAQGRLLGFVSNTESDSISVLDLLNAAPFAPEISVTGGPDAIAITPDGAFVYVARACTFCDGCCRSAVSVIRTAVVGGATDPVLQPPIPVGGFVQGIAIGTTQNGVFAYVTGAYDDNVTGIDNAQVAAGNLQAATAVPVGAYPTAVALTPDGALANGPFAYVANQDDATVSVINTSSNTMVPTPIPVGIAPQAVGSTTLPRLP